jgi:Zn-dependent membrane protease YugP
LAGIIFHLVTTHQEFDDSHFAADQLRFTSIKKQSSELKRERLASN